ncbi:MAG: transporter substrate-binding domain-containing protein, partial [Deltaproteobacteria bacterium]|nr:transporter substrate-binding domain-containing protein [Deltaproteobacteria bacterium]
MKKSLLIGLAVSILFSFCICMPAIGADINLAKKSTIQKILKRGELRVGFESGYVPFCMTSKKGTYIGFEMDFGKRLAKAMGVKFVPVNTAWDGIINALITKK